MFAYCFNNLAGSENGAQLCCGPTDWTVAIAMAIAHVTCWLLMLILVTRAAAYRVEPHWLRNFFVGYICLGACSLLFTMGADLINFTHTIQGTAFTLLIYITVLILSGWVFEIEFYS